MFVSVYWGYGKWCVLIVKGINPLVELSGVKVEVSALPYMSTLIFHRDFTRSTKITQFTFCENINLRYFF